MKKAVLVPSVIGLSVAMLTASCRQEESGRAGAPEPTVSEASEVKELADLHYERTLQRTPEIAYFYGIEIERHDGLSDNKPSALSRAQREDDAMLADLESIDPSLLIGTPEWTTYGILREALEASQGMRICRAELWSVSFMNGWQVYFPILASMQPVGTPEHREQAFTRWSRFPGYLDQEVTNLEEGLAAGYSAAKPVVDRVIQQLDGLLGLPADQSPFLSPAQQAESSEFEQAFARLVEDDILPAVSRYRDFLAETYQPQAREDLAVTANPDGRACYVAALRYHTTLQREPEEVFALGSETVARYRQEIIELGRARYDTDDFSGIIRQSQDDPADRFVDRDDVLQFSQEAVKRSAEHLSEWFGLTPSRECVVEPYPEYQDGTGVQARYEPGSADRPGTYRISLHEPQDKRKGNLETTAFHESNPGHHLQITIAQNLKGVHPITKLTINSGYVEGWARYSEALAEEMGLYESATASILRRAWPARGMVVDPGIHIKGWSRQQAIDFMVESGRIPADQGEQMVDRIADMPGQLTAYDSGGLEIFALRRQAEETLGSDFDIRDFHDRVLENGSVPLWMLRQHVESWLADLGSR